MRSAENVNFWSGEALDLFGGIRLIRCGGHFDGAAVLLWPTGASGDGALLTGDTIQVVPDRRWVSFMYSYPNFVPLNASALGRIVAAVEPLTFDRIHGAFPDLTIQENAKVAVIRSAQRYLKAIS
jgi:glyoxylase-like metal-dependent hydrolase (beta-lactamase superfamily II)